MIARNGYLERIKSSMWNGEIKVITGIRRCGKSTLLFELFYEYLLSQGVDAENIIFVELDKRKYYQYRNPNTLCEYIEGILKTKKDSKIYLFIDEIQMSKKFVIKNEDGSEDEITVYDMLNELKDYKNLDVYVTGSNSKMLSNDIATEFRGRSTQIRVYPLSFSEFYSWKGGDEVRALNEYMLYGGMPALLTRSNDKERKDYLSDLFNEVYLKDLVEHNKIQREDIMNDVLDMLASSISSLTNPNNIANAIGSANREKANPNLVSCYIKHLEDAFLISEVKRYDIKGKEYFVFPNKYYYSDIGLRNARLNFRQFDTGHIMENIIYNELVRRGYSVDVGMVSDRRGGSKIPKEIDFIVNDNDRKIYIQSAYQMSGDEKTNSELDSFKLTGDFFKKVMIRNDIFHNYYDDNGFFHCNLIDFLLGRVELF